MPPPPEAGVEETAPRGIILPLDVVSQPRIAATATRSPRGTLAEKPYSPQRQQDYVRLVVACGLLLILGYLVVFATIEATSWPAHWQQTKEMLQIILPALTGVIGTVIGFYFGTAAASGGGGSPPPGKDSN